MEMHSQSSEYVVCSNNPIYHSGHSSPSTAHQIAPHTPRSVGLLSQLGQVCANNLFVPNPPLSSSPPSSSSGSMSSRGNSPQPSPVGRLVGDDYPYPYVSLVEPPQFKPLFTSSWIETSTPPNEGPHYAFQHAQQQFYELYRPYKTEPTESPLNQIPSHPYTPTFPSDYANSSQPTDFTYQTSCEEYPRYSSARSSVDYNMFPDQNPDYIIGTSNMRYTASSPPDQGCVSPAMVSDGSPRYVEISELPPSPSDYDTPPQADVCNPRAVGGFEEPGQRASPNFPLKRSPSATPLPLLAFADQRSLEADGATPHVQQGADGHSSGESEVDREEYENEGVQAAAPPQQPEPAVQQSVDFVDPSPAPAPTPTPALARTDIPSQPTHETGDALPITVPPPTKRRRGQAGPVPVPNLTKKSRGRSVPTAPNSVSPYGAHRTRRSFVCVVSDCGKCFARGEHLKRHIRSIHTNEKPFVCSFPGCDKAFSRHDNLGQHTRVHKHQGL